MCGVVLWGVLLTFVCSHFIYRYIYSVEWKTFQMHPLLWTMFLLQRHKCNVCKHSPEICLHVSPLHGIVYHPWMQMENPAMHKSRLHFFSFFSIFFIWSERWWNRCLYYPLPALCCFQFVGYWKISPTTDKKIREELMVFLCHYRNKLIFGFKSEGGESEQHVSGDVSRGVAQRQANPTRRMPVQRS